MLPRQYFTLMSMYYSVVGRKQSNAVAMLFFLQSFLQICTKMDFENSKVTFYSMLENFYSRTKLVMDHWCIFRQCPVFIGDP